MSKITKEMSCRAETKMWRDKHEIACQTITALQRERDEARADCKSFWKLRAELYERQLAEARARLAEPPAPPPEAR